MIHIDELLTVLVVHSSLPSFFIFTFLLLISLFNKLRVIKLRFFCRYHYNVADARLAQHIEKGNEDGLFISSVASCQNLWALIMDAGTGFSAQVYELSPYFLHKVHNHVFLTNLPRPVTLFYP